MRESKRTKRLKYLESVGSIAVVFADSLLCLPLCNVLINKRKTKIGKLIGGVIYFAVTCVGIVSSIELWTCFTGKLIKKSVEKDSKTIKVVSDEG